MKKITSKKKGFCNLKFNLIPNLLGVLNLTPDSFSDGGKFNKKNKAIQQAINLYNSGANLIDVGEKLFLFFPNIIQSLLLI